MSAENKVEAMVPMLLSNELAFDEFMKRYRGAMYVGFVANVPTERVVASNGSMFLTFDLSVGTGRKKEGTDKWESIYVQCAWFGEYSQIAKGDVVAVFGSPDITVVNGKAYPKLKVRYAYVVNPNRGGSAANNVSHANRMSGHGAAYGVDRGVEPDRTAIGGFPGESDDCPF